MCLGGLLFWCGDFYDKFEFVNFDGTNRTEILALRGYGCADMAKIEDIIYATIPYER